MPRRNLLTKNIDVIAVSIYNKCPPKADRLKLLTDYDSASHSTSIDMSHAHMIHEKDFSMTS